jgi:hypothetical protein
MKKGMVIRNILNSPEDADASGMVFLNVDITLSEKSGERTKLRGRKRAIFNRDDWESELLWQTVRVIVEHHGGKDEACGALKTVLDELQQQRIERTTPTRKSGRPELTCIPGGDQ